jgi:hypothetical protein
MKLSEWASIAEIVGAAAVVVSLIYVGLQVQDSTRAVRSAAVNDASVAMQAWYQGIGSNRQASDVFLHSITSAEPLSVEDEYQYLMSAHAIFLGMQNSYLLAQEGTLDTTTVTGITSALRGVASLPGFQRYWEQRRGYLDPGFAEYVEGVLAQPAILSTDIYQDALRR